MFNTQWKKNVMLRTVTNAKETISVNIVLLGSIKWMECVSKQPVETLKTA